MDARADDDKIDIISDHRRQWGRNLYVYPVVSRRSKGLSVGVNLNRDQRCNFACVYCQVNRRMRPQTQPIELDVLRRELADTLAQAISGQLWESERFAATPANLRRINDIAFSGDGEPTCLSDFDQAVRTAAEVKNSLGLDAVKIIVITNASQLRSEQFRRALEILDTCNGEIWAKLDAGTEETFRRINRPHPQVSLREIVENISDVSRDRDVVIQSLFMRLDGRPPTPQELDAYCGRLREIIAAGGRIRLVQVHTIARSPASASVAMLQDDELDAVTSTVRGALGDIPVETYYGRDVPPQSAADEAAVEE